MLSREIYQRIKLSALKVALTTSLSFYSKWTKNGIYRGDNHRKDSESKPNAYNQRKSSKVEYQNRSSRWSEPENRNNQIGHNGKCGNFMGRNHRKNQSHSGADYGGFEENHNRAKNNRKHFGTAQTNAGAPTGSRKKKRAYATDDDDEEDEENEDDEDENELIKLSVPDWSTIQCNKPNISYYEPSKHTLDRCKSTIDEYCQRNKIIVKGELPAPVFHIDELSCARQLAANLANKTKIDIFSPLQSHAIPCILSGKSLVGIGRMGFVCRIQFKCVLCIIIQCSFSPTGVARS